MAQLSRAFEAVSLSKTLSGSRSDETGISGSDFSVRVAVTAQAVEELRPIWSNFDHHLDTDIDYYLHNLRNDPTILHPYIVTVSSDGLVESMLIGVVRKHKVPAVITSVNISGPQARELEIEKRGILGRHCPSVDRLVALQLSEALRYGLADFLCFRGLPLRSGLIPELEQLTGLQAKKRGLHVLFDSTLVLTTAEGKRLAVFSGKRRREIARNTRNLNRMVGNRACFKCLLSPSELNTGICDAIAIAATTYKYSLGWGLQDIPQDSGGIQVSLQTGVASYLHLIHCESAFCVHYWSPLQ
jgi:hypothetical protein